MIGWAVAFIVYLAAVALVAVRVLAWCRRGEAEARRAMHRRTLIAQAQAEEDGMDARPVP